MKHKITSLLGVALVAATAVLTGCTDAPPVADKSTEPASAPTPPPALESPAATQPTVSLQEVREHIQNEERAGQDGETELPTPQAALPDLFDVEPEAKKSKLSGKILTREEAESLTQSVDGIQLEFEVKVD